MMKPNLQLVSERAEDRFGEAMVAHLRDGLRNVFGPVSNALALRDHEIDRMIALVDNAIQERIESGMLPIRGAA